MRQRRGIFEFHQADPQTLLLGLDNRVWTLSRAPEVLAAATPEDQVQRLFGAHFNGPMGFDAASVKTKRTWLSARLQHRIAGYFALRAIQFDTLQIVSNGASLPATWRR